MVANCYRRETHKAVRDESLEASALSINSKHVHIVDAHLLAEEALASCCSAQTHRFLNPIAPSISGAILKHDFACANFLVCAGLLVIVALDATASPAQVRGHPEPVRAGVNENAQSLAWRSNVELEEDFHAEVTTHGSPRLLSILAVIGS